MTRVHIPQVPCLPQDGIRSTPSQVAFAVESSGVARGMGPNSYPQAAEAAHNSSRNCPQDWDTPRVGLIQKGELRPVTGSRAPEARPPAVISPTEGLRQEPHRSLFQLPPPPALTRGSLEGDMWDRQCEGLDEESRGTAFKSLLANY